MQRENLRGTNHIIFQGIFLKLGLIKGLTIAAESLLNVGRAVYPFPISQCVAVTNLFPIGDRLQLM